MNKKRLNIVELIKENKEKIWKDEKEMEKIEKRIDAKYVSVKNKSE